jgi:DNA replication licensing factor MCM2
MIDEFDKMNEQDRTSIHEAMEQQSISISKAGIVTRLQARCSVIAAANPIRGRYDGSLTFLENVDLTDPILSRFDILAVVRDMVNLRRDEDIAKWVVDNHIRGHPELKDDDEDGDQQMNEDERPEHLSTEDLKKYIMYAKHHCKPKLHNIDTNKIGRFYADLRQKSMEGGGIPIAVRHIESVLRMSEAHARMHLRDMVVEEDVDIAIRTLLQSFIATQKRSVSKALERHFQQYLQYKRDNVEILLHILDDLVRESTHLLSQQETDIQIDLKHLQSKALEYNIANVNVLFKEQRFENAGYVFKPDKERPMITRTLLRPGVEGTN